MDQISKEALDVGNEEIYKFIEEKYRPTAEEVKAAAKDLVDYAQDLQNKHGLSVLDQITSLDTNSEAGVLNFSKKFIKSEQDYEDLMKRVFSFQNKANEFLGQKISMIFVSISPSSGKVTLYNAENSISDLTIGKSAESKGGGYTGRFSTLSKIKDASRMVTNSQQSNQAQTSLDNAFKEVWQRYRISKNKLKLGGAAYILWFLKDKWDGAWISGAGPLGEAYVAFFINSYVFSNLIEPAVQDFMMNESYGSVRADNASGFLTGDVTKGSQQFGVKIRGAQPLGYIEIIKYAQEVLQATDLNKYLNSLKEELENKASKNMVKPLSEIMTKEYKNLYKEIKKHTGGNLQFST